MRNNFTNDVNLRVPDNVGHATLALPLRNRTQVSMSSLPRTRARTVLPSSPKCIVQIAAVNNRASSWYGVGSSVRRRCNATATLAKTIATSISRTLVANLRLARSHLDGTVFLL